MKGMILPLAVFVALLLPFSAVAQEEQAKHNSLAGRFSIEHAAGPTAHLYPVKGDVSSASANGAGSTFFVRLGYNVTDSFGAFAKFDLLDSSSSEVGYFGPLNQADGDRYRYRFDSGRSSCYREMCNFSIGTFYRIADNRKALIPRVSLGLGMCRFDEVSYTRQIKTGASGPEYISESAASTQSADYLMDTPAINTYHPVFQMAASLQMALRPRKAFFLFIEPGVVCSLSKIKINRESRGSKNIYEPKNWAEAVSMAGSTGWMPDNANVSSSVLKRRFGTFASLYFGFGFNF